MVGLVSRFDARFYSQYDNNWDDVLFRERILERVSPDSTILDLGAGAGIISHMNFLGKAKKVCGVDLDPRVENNPMLDEGIVSDVSRIPYPDNSFDLVFSDNVLEHLDRPEEVFREVARVTRPGGYFLIKTPNKYHYMPLIARLTPTGFHKFVNRLRGRKVDDTFPTRYLANSRSALTQLGESSGFSINRIELLEGRPEYLRISWITYPFGILYERLVNSTDLLQGLRILLIAEFQLKE